MACHTMLCHAQPCSAHCHALNGSSLSPCAGKLLTLPETFLSPCHTHRALRHHLVHYTLAPYLSPCVLLPSVLLPSLHRESTNACPPLHFSRWSSHIQHHCHHQPFSPHIPLTFPFTIPLHHALCLLPRLLN
ncbi:unnamed protein product [Closterium sp. NIES-53]